MPDVAIIYAGKIVAVAPAVDGEACAIKPLADGEVVQVGDDWGAAQLASLKAQLRAQATTAMQAAAQRALSAIDNADSLERLKEVYSRLTRTLGQFF